MEQIVNPVIKIVGIAEGQINARIAMAVITYKSLIY